MMKYSVMFVLIILSSVLLSSTPGFSATPEDIARINAEREQAARIRREISNFDQRFVQISAAVRYMHDVGRINIEEIPKNENILSLIKNSYSNMGDYGNVDIFDENSGYMLIVDDLGAWWGGVDFKKAGLIEPIKEVLRERSVPGVLLISLDVRRFYNDPILKIEQNDMRQYVATGAEPYDGGNHAWALLRSPLR